MPAPVAGDDGEGDGAPTREERGMGHADGTRPVPIWMDNGTGWTEAELALREGTALLGLLALGVLHVADAALEAWPLPFSRSPGRGDRP
jgi:hypothetical protein